MKKIIRFLYRYLIRKPKNAFFRVKVAGYVIFGGSFFVISNIKQHRNGHKFYYRMRSLGLSSDKIRRRILGDAMSYYTLRREKIRKD